MKLLLFVFVGLTCFSCKKLDKDHPIEFAIKAHIPYSDEPISGVKYTIREYKSKNGKLGEIEYTDFVLEGMTDANGSASIAFAPRKNKNYHYDLSFDYSSLQFVNYTGSYSLIKAPTYVHLVRNNQQDYEIRALPLMQMRWNFKNQSCFDGNDTFRYKVCNLDETPNYNFNSGDPWIEGIVLNGCVDLSGDYLQRLSGHYIFKWEAVRGGATTTGIDTFLFHLEEMMM
ncbi:hypothetical protein [Fluviicola sp.]|uniref:hypothetical protein n=1 Tax=Fluviicola sp. TaxID=1917219 RepID=UPI0031D69639